MFLFHHVPRAGNFGRAMTVTAAVAVLGILALVLLAVTPARSDDSNVWCGPAWACEQAAPSVPMTASVPDKWTAIAISKSNMSVMGASHGQDSQAAAKQLALSNCRRNGALDCNLLDWGVNYCLAIAVSQPDGFYGFDGGPSREQAEARALAQCRHVKGQNCVVQVSPCASDDPRWESPSVQAPRPVGVDSHTIGIWELPVNGGLWVWEIDANGTYNFHSEAADGAAPNSGTFSANGGRWALQATNGYTDGGTYHFQPPDTLVATGRLGIGAWHLRASAANKQ